VFRASPATVALDFDFVVDGGDNMTFDTVQTSLAVRPEYIRKP
jgi:hypothetical protein